MSMTHPSAAAIYSDESALDRLAHVIDHVSHLLPAQGPITSFIHHNTLHAFEHLPFDQAVRQGGQMFGCEPYLAEADFRAELARGRIQLDDLQAVLREDLASGADEPILHFASRLELRLAMLRFPLAAGTSAELHWFMTETEALRRFDEHAPPATRTQIVEQTRHWAMRDLQSIEPLHGAFQDSQRRMRQPLSALFQQFDRGLMEHWSDETWQSFTLQALWRVCRAGVHGVKWNPRSEPHPTRHRDLLLEATGEDTDQLVNELLIRLSAGLTDQGLARWPLPGRRHGLLHAFCQIFGVFGDPPDRWLRGLREEIDRKTSPRVSSLEWIHESLTALGVDEQEWEPFLRDTLLALRGWAGMIRQVALRSDKVVHTIESDSLLDYLAIRLLLERFALDFVARRSLPGYAGDLAKLRQHLRDVGRFNARETRHQNVDVRAFAVFQLAQFMSWLPRDLYRLSHSQWALLVGEIEAFDNFERRRIYQHAYERRYRIETLDAIAVSAAQPKSRSESIRFQAIFCIDEREESFRRHLEEVSPDVETFGAAGFYGVAMYYRGVADAHYMPLCPIVALPQHWVMEDVAYPLEKQHQRRAWFRRTIGSASHQMHVASRSATGGAVSALFGVLATAPMVMRVVFPRWKAALRRSMWKFVAPPPQTQLLLERASARPSDENGGIGYSVKEMADVVERLLRDIGLTSGFARLVFIIGHGSSSHNNPHESAYNCGACGGGCGGPNARAFAQMANDSRVRRLLEERGIAIPTETAFVGGVHDTCNDGVEFFDLDRTPLSHKADLLDLQECWLETRRRNARERCRRFVSAPLTLTNEEALHHVESRAEDLAQARPECGHATNAVCFVGRRTRTRNLYMDRRTFLVSYDPTQDDPEAAILARILAAVVPVCAGINLEYYFSRIDSVGWGCGTKLPHNVTSLLGVMDGAASDLRPGLPWQMVEIHEPVRLLFIIENSPNAMLGIMERNPMIGQLCRNGWVQIATLDPHSSDLQLFDGEEFNAYSPTQEHLPRAHSSVSWYRGWRDHLGYAMILPPPGDESRIGASHQ